MTAVSFEGARHIVAAALAAEGDPRLPALWGWENADVWVIGFDYPPGEAPLGDEVPVVDKTTGQLRWEFNPTPGEPVAPNLRQVGNSPG